MRLANGIVLDKEKTFGVLKFSALRHEVRVENEDGTTSEETVANANYRGADVEWYIKADDIVLKNKGGQPAGNPQNHAPQGQQKK